MKSHKQPDPTDIHVGSRVRMARMQAGLSQDRLAEHLGITFQQVQKYEKGRNRISASKLVAIARITGRSAAWFFAGLGVDTEQPDPVRDEIDRAIADLDPVLLRDMAAIKGTEIGTQLKKLAHYAADMGRRFS